MCLRILREINNARNSASFISVIFAYYATAPRIVGGCGQRMHLRVYNLLDTFNRYILKARKEEEKERCRKD